MKLFTTTTDDGRRTTDDGRRLDGYTISSPCEPNGSGELKTVINSLKKSKSPGEDNVLNEYFIEAGDILISHIKDIFNGIFNSGDFPDFWSKGIIVPVYKKGEPTLADNFRAITLSSYMSKLFTSILNNRIYSWAEEHDKLSDAQFGFRKERSTVDAIFHFTKSNSTCVK